MFLFFFFFLSGDQRSKFRKGAVNITWWGEDTSFYVRLKIRTQLLTKPVRKNLHCHKENFNFNIINSKLWLSYFFKLSFYSLYKHTEVWITKCIETNTKSYMMSFLCKILTNNQIDKLILDVWIILEKYLRKLEL